MGSSIRNHPSYLLILQTFLKGDIFISVLLSLPLNDVSSTGNQCYCLPQEILACPEIFRR
jgi:hypothetical protein